MYLNTSNISLTFVIIIVMHLNCQVLSDGNTPEEKLVLTTDSDRNEKVVESEGGSKDMENLCKEFCTTRRNKECKLVFKFKGYDADKNVCTCVDRQGLLMDSKIYKAKQPLNDQKMTKEKLKKPLRRRTKRQMLGETVLEDGTQVVGMTVTPPHPARRAQYFGGGGGHGYGHHGGRPPPMSMGPMGPHACTQFTCMNECSYGCDSLCRMNLECYCSCPDDISYEYYDDSFFGSIFG